jgi:transposase
METVLAEMTEQEQAAEHHDVTVLLSMPGAGRVVAATMLAEASQALAQRDYHALRSYTGVAPVTRQSGKRSSTVMRRSCNQRLRNAVYHWSMGSIQHDERSREQYAALRRKGHSHPRALRGVADRLLAILTAMLKAGTTYDPRLRPPVTLSSRVHDIA